MNKAPKPQCMWMVKAHALAPYWGISFTRKEMYERLRKDPNYRDLHSLRVVRVLVQEATDEHV